MVALRSFGVEFSTFFTHTPFVKFICGIFIMVDVWCGGALPPTSNHNLILPSMGDVV
jgi:hypothetical protein